jgi:hypothetical protein
MAEEISDKDRMEKGYDELRAQAVESPTEARNPVEEYQANLERRETQAMDLTFRMKALEAAAHFATNPTWTGAMHGKVDHLDALNVIAMADVFEDYLRNGRKGPNPLEAAARKRQPSLFQEL